ncbi:hypothetical protein [Rubrivivax albus]|nr:hypothetical protein [Rubrivivax albus]
MANPPRHNTSHSGISSITQPAGNEHLGAGNDSRGNRVFCFAA